MVERSGFLVIDGEVYSVPTQIKWDKGFDRAAKTDYIGQLHTNLAELFPSMTIMEVTTAGLVPEGKALSPIYIYSGDISIEDLWQEAKVDGYAGFAPVGAGYEPYQYDHFYCFYAQHLLPTIRQIDIFTDVFYNPQKAKATQARAIAVLKALDLQDKLDIIKDREAFAVWWRSNVKNTKVN